MIQNVATHWRSAPRQTRVRLTYALLVVLVVVHLFPFFWILGGSFKNRENFFAEPMNLIPSQPTIQNYVTAWEKGNFGRYFWNSVIVSAIVVFAVVILAGMTGYALARIPFPGRGLLRALIVLTLFLPAGYTIIPTFEIMLALRLTSTLWALIVLGIAGGLGFYSFLYWAYFTTLPREVEEAAMVDGANTFQVFWRVMFPLARPMAGTVALLCFLNTWNDFFTPLVFTLGKSELRTLPIGMFAFLGERTTDWTPMLAATVITLLPIIVVFLFLQRYFVEAVAGAIK
jgi:raffinose/stachyose/melibiose transport system permease protein